MNDHGTHEALYLNDPDGNGLELYWDRPEDEWPRDAEGHLTFANAARDLNGMVRELFELGQADRVESQLSASRSARSSSPPANPRRPSASRGHSACGRSQYSSRSLPSGSEM